MNNEIGIDPDQPCVERRMMNLRHADAIPNIRLAKFLIVRDYVRSVNKPRFWQTGQRTAVAVCREDTLAKNSLV